MFDVDRWQEIWSSLRKHKLRTLLTIFGVFWGIFMLVMLMAVGRGLQNGVYSMFGNLAKNTMFIGGGKSALPYKGMKVGRFIAFDNSDFEAMKRDLPEIRYLAGGTSLWGDYFVTYNHQNGAFKVGGDMPEILNIRGLFIPKGRFINELDIREKRKVAVLGEKVAEVLFGKEDPIGKYIQIKGVYFLVVGQFYIENSGGDGRGDAEKIFVPLTTLQNIFNAPNRITTFAITPKDDIDPNEFEKKAKAYLAGRHLVSPDDKSAVNGWNSGRMTNNFKGLFDGINIFLWFVSAGTILAGIVGVSNIMLITVKERTREIGIRKALGATPNSIVQLIIQESLFITLFSGYLGLLAGVSLVEGVRYFMEKFKIRHEYFSNPQVDISVALVAVGILVVVGTLAGLFPALRAARINPIEALKDE